jgi:citrate lyase beta subunit
MIESYFFVPAHSKRFIEKSLTIKADHFILDLEDAVPLSEKSQAILNCLEIQDKEKYFIRPYLEDSLKKDFFLLNKLASAGFKKILLPKSKNTNEILANLEEVDVFLLVEQASTYLNAQQIVEKHKDKIKGLAFGSQDFTSSMNLKYNEDILNIVRLNLLIICKTYNLKFIDTASMNISKDEDAFSAECINAFDMGCDGKFIIHPNQLRLLNSANYFSKVELDWAISILNEIDIKNEDFGAIKINGEIIEKPHLNKLKLIDKYLKVNGIK